MSNPHPRSMPKYTVTSIVPETDFPASGQVTPSQRVSFTADNGVTGSVLVPDTVINDISAVQTLIDAKVVALSAILNLGS